MNLFLGYTTSGCKLGTIVIDIPVSDLWRFFFPYEGLFNYVSPLECEVVQSRNVYYVICCL